jgi:23S rRNA pseudouridine1911/1915/1917 synthase
VNALIAHCGPSLTGIGGVMRPGIVHRLDKDTSGTMVVAKTDAAHHGLTGMFAAHDIDRRYHALVWGTSVERDGTIDEPIGRASYDRKRQAITTKGRNAVTHWQLLRRFPPFGSHVECRLETGRTHQIRVHMAHINHGLIGDPLYGRAPRSGQMPDNLARTSLSQMRDFRRQALHAARLGFDHPITGEALHFETPLPDDMAGLLALMERTVSDRATGKTHPSG